MSNQAAFFQILYQNETLFRLEKPALPELKEVKPVVTEIVQAPLPPAQAVKSPATVAVTSPQTAPAPATSTDNFPPLKHKILILIDEQKNKEMPASEALLLDNILKAVGHSSANSDILNFSFLPGQNARSVLSEKKTNFFITFGVPLIKLNLDLLLAPYTPKIVEGVWFLLADPLAVIEADRNLKKKLWQALQKMFEMS